MSLEQKINNYQTTSSAKDLLRSTKIALLVGIAGAGKDTIKKRLLADGGFRDIVSHTTRPARSNNGVREKNGIDYHFVDDQTIESMIDTRQFIEAKYVHGTVYGTSIDELQQVHDQNKIALTDIDVQGVDEYKRLAAETVAVFILPPDYATWRKRLEKRYQSADEFDIEWPKRRASAIRELEHALAVSYYHFLINDDIKRAVKVAKSIATREDSYNRQDDEARLKARDLLDEIKLSH